MRTRPTLSVVIITQNRAEWLRRSMESVDAVADEFVIVDGGSRDGTKEVVASFPKAKWFERPWPGDYGDQKNWAFDRATGDWILSLDHDERMGANFRAVVGRLLRSRRHDSYQFARYNLVSDRPPRYIRNDLLDSIKLRRLFRNEPRFRYEPGREGGDKTGKVHHGFPRETCGRPQTVPGCHIFHFNLVWATDDDRVEKVAAYNRAEPFWTELNARFTLFEDFPHEIVPCEESLDDPAPITFRDGPAGAASRAFGTAARAARALGRTLVQVPRRWPLRRQTVSCCVLARGDAGPLRAAMESVAGAVDEFVVVDGTDRPEIRAAVGRFPRARYLVRPWDHEGRQKNHAFDAAQGAWILELETTERMSARFRARLPRLMRSWRRASYTFHRLLLVAESPPRAIRTEVLDAERHCRLFRNEPRFRYADYPAESRDRTGAASSFYDRVRRGRSKDLKDCAILAYDLLLWDRAVREAMVRERTQQYPPLQPLFERRLLPQDRAHEIVDVRERR